MLKTVCAVLVLALTAALLLPACASRYSAATAQPESELRTSEAETESLTETVFTETTDPFEDAVALPQERPQTTEAEESAEAVTSAAETALPQTATTAAEATTAATTAATTTTKPATTTTTKPETTTASTTAAAKSETSSVTVADSTTSVTETSTTKVSATKAAADHSAQSILNRAPLHPQKTNDAELDAAVQAVFDRIFTRGMSTYDKVLACYNYIINNSEYGRTAMVVTREDLNAYQTEQESWNVLFAKRILNTGKGVCDDYASLFLVMMRAIGLDCYYTHGFTTNTKGETKDHVWDTITVAGTDYIFDAQVEDKQSANGIKYTFFCKTYDSSIAKIYSGYDLAADKAAYNAFRRNG